MTWDGQPGTTTPGSARVDGISFLFRHPVPGQHGFQPLGRTLDNCIGSRLTPKRFKLLSCGSTARFFRMEICFLLKSGTYSLSGTTFHYGFHGLFEHANSRSTTLSPQIISSDYFIITPTTQRR